MPNLSVYKPPIRLIHITSSRAVQIMQIGRKWCHWLRKKILRTGQTFTTHTTLNTEHNQIAIKVSADNQYYRNASS